MIADAAMLKTAGEWEAMGNRIRTEFASALVKLGDGWEDGSFLRGGEFPELSAIEWDFDRLLIPIRELVALESQLTSGFIPADPPDEGVFERDVPTQPSPVSLSESDLHPTPNLRPTPNPASAAQSYRIENSSDSAFTGSREFRQAPATVNQTIAPSPESAQAPRTARATRSPAVDAVAGGELFAEPVERGEWTRSAPVHSLRELARLVESSPAPGFQDVFPDVFPDVLPDGLAHDPPRVASLIPEVERAEPIPELISESVDLWETVAQTRKSHDRSPVPPGKLRRREMLFRMGLDVSRQAGFPVSNNRKAHASLPQAPSTGSSASPANEPGGRNIPQPRPDPEWPSTKEPELRAMSGHARDQTAGDSGDVDAILEALSNEIRRSYRRFYGD